jgi:hypothetical protein
MIKYLANKKDLLFIFIIYCISSGLILLNKGVFWDDWVLYNVNMHDIIDRFHQSGSIWPGYLHSFILTFDHSILFYRILIFFAYFFSAILLNKILYSIKEIDYISRIIIVLIFILFPVNSARITLICLPYAVCHFLFFLGLYFVDKFLSSKKMVFRILALLVLFCSFTITSLLVFYCIVFLYIVYREKSRIKSIKSLVALGFRYLDFTILPFIYWIIKLTYMVPYGLYEGHNNINIKNFLGFYPLIWDSFHSSFVQILDISLRHTSFLVLVFGIILWVIMLCYNFEWSECKSRRTSVYFLILGIFLFICAVFPYIAVGSVVQSDDWNSRNQLLVPLGVALILNYGSVLCCQALGINSKIRVLLLSLLIAMFININIQTYLDFQKDWYKQLSIIENIKNDEEIRNHTTFLFADCYPELNANNRIYRFYEYTGFMKEAFHDESRFGNNALSKLITIEDIKVYSSSFNSSYNLKDYTLHEPEIVVFIKRGSLDLQNRSNIGRLIYYDLFKHSYFKDMIKKVIIIETMKY